MFHKLIYLQLLPLITTVILMPETEITFRQKYWKFNANFLNDEKYCSMVRKILSSIKINEDIDSYGKKWEFLLVKERIFY